jgi:hypothetical protein
MSRDAEKRSPLLIDMFGLGLEIPVLASTPSFKIHALFPKKSKTS